MSSLDEMASAATARHAAAHAAGEPIYGLDRAPFGPPPAPISIRFRAALASDESYILDSWRQSWRLADRNRNLRGSDYALRFDRFVRRGVLAERDTSFVVGCAPDNPREIWCWVCYTPGPIPTVHFAVTKMRAASLDVSPRRLGFLTRLLATAGIRDSLVYTFRPAERVHRSRSEPLHAEAGLLEAARRCGIRASYHSVEEFLAHRGSR